MEKKLNAQVLYGGTPRCGKSIRQYHCLNCDKKMPCIQVNLISDTEICLKDEWDDD